MNNNWQEMMDDLAAMRAAQAECEKTLNECVQKIKCCFFIPADKLSEKESDDE